jgi:hypothetical protein
MTVIVGVAAKGSPGVSLAMWGLLHCWPRPVIGMEADLSGGSWALRHGLTCEPGLASLAATQGPLTFDIAADHTVGVGEQRGVVCAPRETTIVAAAMGWLNDRLLAWPNDGDLLIDAGRFIASASSEHAAVRRADTVLLFAHPRPEDLGAIAHTVTELGKLIRPSTPIKLVLIGNQPYSSEAIIDALRVLTNRRIDISVGAVIPDDPNGAEDIRVGSKRAAKIIARWFGPLAIELAAASAHRTVNQSARVLGVV